MLSQDLERVSGPKAGKWFRWKFGDRWATVTFLVPALFPAYARIFPPARDAEGSPATWAEVARRLGRTAHPEMQRHLVGTADQDGIEGSEWDGGVPPVGAMPIDDLDRLCRILADHTSDPFHCFFGISAKLRPAGVGTPSGKERRRRRLSLDAGRHEYDSTLVGGGRDLIDALLAAPGLEALEVAPETRLTAFADKINLVEEPRSNSALASLAGTEQQTLVRREQ